MREGGRTSAFEMNAVPFMCIYAYLLRMEALAGGALDGFEPVRIWSSQ